MHCHFTNIFETIYNVPDGESFFSVKDINSINQFRDGSLILLQLWPHDHNLRPATA